MRRTYFTSWRLAALALPLLLAPDVGCKNGGLATHLATTPDVVGPGAAKCKVMHSPLKPMVAEWSSNDRADLEERLKDEGLVAVRYQGCEMEVLYRCRAPGAYSYRGVNVKKDAVAIDNADELYAKLPIGAFRLEATLRKAGQLSVETMLVGSLKADRGDVERTQLQGACDGATHFIAGVQVGAFRFFAGGQGEAGAGVGVGRAGAGWKSRASKDLLGQDGDMRKSSNWWASRRAVRPGWRSSPAAPSTSTPSTISAWISRR